MLTALRDHAAWLRHALGNRNPLRRRIDRIAAVTSALFLVLALCAIPAAVFFGSVVHRDLARRGAETTHHASPVQAVLISDARMSKPDADASRTYRQVATARVRWHAAEGVRVSDVRVPADSTRGEQLRLWIDQHGQRVAPPPSPTSVMLSAVFAGTVLLSVLHTLCWAGVLGCQRLARRVAGRAWDREWLLLQHGGSWSQS